MLTTVVMFRVFRGNEPPKGIFYRKISAETAIFVGKCTYIFKKMLRFTKYIFTSGGFGIEDILVTSVTHTGWNIVFVVGAPALPVERWIYGSNTFRLERKPQRNLPQHSNSSLQRTMSIWHKLPSVLWPIVGDFIFMDIAPHDSGGLRLTIKPAIAYAIIFPGDEQGEGFIQPCLIS